VAGGALHSLSLYNDYTLLLHAIHLDGARMRQTNVANTLSLAHGRQRVKILTVENLKGCIAITAAIVSIYGIALLIVVYVNGEITHSQGSEILEEVSALRWVNEIAWQNLFHYQFRG
jgi:hypothetical protein